MVTPDIFKKALSQFCTGVTVVTVNTGDEFHGLTVSAFSSVSLNPPMILFCRKVKSLERAFLTAGKHFVVNILSEAQQDVAMRFANPRLTPQERFAGLSFSTTPTHHVPVLHGSMAYLECRTDQVVNAGDHTVYFGEVMNIGIDDHTGQKDPLLYYSSAFRSIQQTEPVTV